MNVFAYGTLTDPEQVEYLLGRSVEMIDNVALPDYKRRWQGYFFAIPAEGEEIRGRLLTGLSHAEVEALDAYENVESGLYQRVPATVKTSTGPVDCEVYIEG